MFKIFVGNLSPTTTVDALRMLFLRHVDVEDIALPTDEETGKLRGFAIVMVKDEQKAKAAMSAMRGARLNGRPLVINQARKKGQAPPKRENRRGFRSRPGGSAGGQGGGSSSGGGSYGRPRAFGSRPGGPRFRDRGPSSDSGGSSSSGRPGA